MFRAVKRFIDNYSPGYTYHLLNIARYYDHTAKLVVVALNEQEDWKDEIATAIHDRFNPFKFMVWRGTQSSKLEQLVPDLATQVAKDGRTTVYICREGVCQEPLNELPAILEALGEL